MTKREAFERFLKRRSRRLGFTPLGEYIKRMRRDPEMRRLMDAARKEAKLRLSQQTGRLYMNR